MKIKSILKKNKFIYVNLKKIQLLKKYVEVKFFYLISLKYNFRKTLKYSLNLDDPKTFCEKIQWLKLNYRDDDIVNLTDKVLARDHIAKMVGEDILIDLYGVYDSVEEIDISSLPDRFVLKPSHSCGRIFICKDKNKVNWDKQMKSIRSWLKENFYYEAGEWQYKDLTPRIICERLLQEDINDYKIYCFNGNPYCTQVISNRKGESYNSNYYDLEWNLMDINRADHGITKTEIGKPINYDRMLSISKIVSKKFPFVRMDFYEVEGKLFFGEATFTPANGMIKFHPEKYDLIFGNKLDISIYKQTELEKSNE